tara:strand:+ start:1822 stop:1995 length:174 start_codon:yes stop_codon:yes gene_type:complete
MDGELGIYNKLGGGDKYRNVSSMDGGSTKVDKKKDRIKRLEKKIEILQNELNKLKKK